MPSKSNNPTQQKVWDNIAEEWHEYKKSQDPEVIKFIKNSKGNLLDLGCGSGRYFAKTKATIHGVDFSEEMLKLAKKRAKKLGINAVLTKADISKKIPYEDNFFGNAIFISALHCIEGKTNRKNALKELFRILKPQGKCLIKVWNKLSPRFKNKGKKSYIGWTDKGKRYYYLYDEDELKKDLESVGFKIIEINSTKPGNKQNTSQEISCVVQKPKEKN